MKKYVAWGAVILAAGAAVASLITALPAQDSYCTVCGTQQEMRSYGLRFTSQTLFNRRDVKATPFSALLEEKRLVAPHPHEWLAPEMAPDPRNEFGPPVLESLAFLSAPRVVNFTRDVADYADPVTIENWKETIMQPHYTRVIDEALRFSRVPAEGFADRTEFLTWWGEHAYALSHRIRQLTEHD